MHGPLNIKMYFLYCFVYVYLFLFVLSVLVQGILPPNDNSIAVSYDDGNKTKLRGF